MSKFDFNQLDNCEQRSLQKYLLCTSFGKVSHTNTSRLKISVYIDGDKIQYDPDKNICVRDRGSDQ